MSVASAAVSIAGIAILAFVAAGLSRSEMIRRITTDITLSAQMLAAQLDSEMYERYTDVQQMATTPPLVAALDAAPESRRLLVDQLRASMPVYAWVGFADPHGRVLAASGGLLEGESVAQRPWFKEGLKGPFVGDVHEAVLLARLLEAPKSGEPLRFVDIAFPVRTGANLIGVLGAHLGLAWVEDLRRRALQGAPEKEVWVLTADGAVIVGPRRGETLYPPERLAQMRRARAGAFEDGSGAQAMLTAFAVTGGHEDYPGLGWIVVARQDASMAFDVPTRVGATIIALGAVILIGTLLISVWFSRRLTRPLAELTRVAGEIGRDPQVTMLPRLRGALEVIQLSAALRALLRRLGSVEARFMEHAQRYQEDIAALRQIADSDPLTGLMNRRSFLNVAESALRGTRSSDSLGILMADIDHFKSVNDTYGHAAGDTVIRHVADTISACLRTQDRVARFGGEEFVVLLLDVAESDVRVLAERIRMAIAESGIPHEGRTLRVTVSIGAAIARLGDRDVDSVIERADFALYEAKNSGRNRVSLSPGLTRVA